MEFENKVRLPFFINRPQYPVEESVYVKANGARVVQNVSISKELQGSTDAMPAVWHERLIVALKHDSVHIASKTFTGYFRSGSYEPEWSDENPLYPVAQAKFKGFEDGWAARASRCDVCTEEMNLELQDDTISIEQGQSHTFDVSANDFIACDTPTFEILFFSATYLESATVSAAGVLSLTVKDNVPAVQQVPIVIYRVTCGTATATATVIAGVTGTGPALCPMPTNLTHSVDATGSSPVVTLSWQAPDPAPALYFYQVERASDGVKVAESFTDALSANLAGQAYSTGYVVRLYGVCQDGEQDRYSTPVTLSYTTPAKVTAGLPHEAQAVYVYPVEDEGQIKAEGFLATPVVDPIFISGTMTSYNGPQESRTFSLMITPGQTVGRSVAVFSGVGADYYSISGMAIYPAESKAQSGDKIIDLTATS